MEESSIRARNIVLGAAIVLCMYIQSLVILIITSLQWRI